MTRIARTATLAGLSLLVLAADAPSAGRHETRTEAFQVPVPPVAGEGDGVLSAHVTEPGRVTAEATWLPSHAPLELTLTEWTSAVCVQRGTGRAVCTTDVTADELRRFGGVISVRASVAEVQASVPARGTLALTVPMPELATEEWLFVAPDAFRTTFRVQRPGPLVVELAWAHEPGEEPTRGDDAEMRLDVRGPYVQGYGATALTTAGHSPLRIEHTVRGHDLYERGLFHVTVTPVAPSDGRSVRRATATLRVSAPVAR